MDSKCGEAQAVASTSRASILEGLHPLLNEHILGPVYIHILSQPGSKDVLRDVRDIRLVCKQWKGTMTRIYRRPKRCQTKGLPPPFIQWENSAKILHPGVMCDFLKTMGSSDLIPFQSYEISSDLLTHGLEQIVEDFLWICGPETVSLFHVVEDGEGVEKFNLGGLPPNLDLMKLARIEICFLKTWMETFEGEKHGFGTYLELIISEAKGLKEFKFYAQLIRDLNRRDEVVFRQFEEIISWSLPSTLKSLALHMPIQKKTLMTLMERGLELEEFAMTCFYPLWGDAFSKFLECQAATLKGLRILKSISEELSLVLEFPPLPQLVALEMPDVKLPKEFSFASTFPNLASLEIEKEWTGENTLCKFLSSVHNTAPSLKQLHLPSSFQMAPHVKKLSQCFPNVTELHLSPSEDLEETLSEVFTHFGKVERLQIIQWGGWNADSVFSGVPREDCERISGLPNFDGINLEVLQTKPSILNLSRLKTLVVMEPVGRRQDGMICGGSGPLNLTDFTAHFIFLKLESLRELQLTVWHGMRHPILKRLREKLRVTIMNGQVVCRESEYED